MTAAAAAGIFSPAVGVIGAESEAGSPNEKLSVAVIGVRGRGGDHARAYQGRPDCTISYICDADEAIGAKVAEKFESKPKYVADMRRIFDDKSVDFVSIATPNHWHSLAAIWAMQAGKDVYVEKPLSHNISEGRRMVQVARKYDRICQGGTQYRSAGTTRATARYIAEGKLGQIKLVHCYTYRARNPIGPKGEYEVPASVDYNLWAGPAPMQVPLRRQNFHYDWHWIWDYGNGELGNNSVHPVDAMRLMTGLQGLGRGVISYGGRHFDDAGETPNTQVTIHDFGDTTVIQEVRNLKTAAPEHGGSVFIQGTEGFVISSLTANTAYDPDGNLVEKIEGENEDHFGNFVKAVKSRKREDQNAEILEGHISTAVVHVGNISQRLGSPASPGEIIEKLKTIKANTDLVGNFEGIRKHLAENDVDIEKQKLTLGPWLEIDSEKESFVNNPAADAFLTRDYRKPFVVPAADAI
jgi:predicted dehydrogenase